MERLIPLAIVAIVIGLLAGLVKASSDERNRWETFKVAHECKQVAKIKGEVFNTFSTDAKGNLNVGIASTSDKTGWACNDGITYYR